MGRNKTETKRLIGLRIKQVRHDKKLTQDELSERVGISSKYLSSIERGKRTPSLDTLIDLSLMLGVRISVLVDFAGIQEIPTANLKKENIKAIRNSDREKNIIISKFLKAISV